MKYNKITFYNYFHNGDIHVSRTFISQICKYLNINECFYFHKNSPILLEDLKFIKHTSHIHNFIDYKKILSEKEKELYINTWYAAENGKYMGMAGGINFDCLYFLFEDICKYLGFSLSNISKNPFDFFPTINYNNLNTINIDNFFTNTDCNDNILVCNNRVLSGQSVNFDLTSIILNLSKIHPNKTWILSNKDIDFDRQNYPNVIYTSEIIKKENGSDLNETAYLSLKCNLIIGRASGPFTFSICKENWLNPNKKIISFSNLGSNIFWLGNWGLQNNLSPIAKIIESKETNINNVFNIINSLI